MYLVASGQHCCKIVQTVRAEQLQHWNAAEALTHNQPTIITYNMGHSDNLLHN